MTPESTARLLNSLFDVCGDSNVTCTIADNENFDLAITDGKDTVHAALSQEAALGLANYLKRSQLRTAYLWLTPIFMKMVPQPANSVIEVAPVPVSRLERTLLEA
ncbi:MAG: hypothetical protein JRN21_09295 [Nitrososphaerota archaeon]|nr:hypothetical protein [Nitrososphaerota archaeon]